MYACTMVSFVVFGCLGFSRLVALKYSVCKLVLKMGKKEKKDKKDKKEKKEKKKKKEKSEEKSPEDVVEGT